MDASVLGDEIPQSGAAAVSGKRGTLRHELMAEFFATFVLILGGVGGVSNVSLAPRLAAIGYDWNTIAWGWGLAVMVAVYVGGGVSGAHINPAVTLAMAARRGFAWSKVVPYCIAQTAGAFVGALAVYLVYREGLASAGMPNVWATGPGSTYSLAFWGASAAGEAVPYSMTNAFTAEVFGTMFLVLGVVAYFDKGNWGRNSVVLAPLIVGLIVVGVGLTLGGPSGYAINPARDFGPRLFGAFVGTEGLFAGWYWLAVPVLGPFVGGPLAVLLYDIFIAPGLGGNET
jgi:glycerol uptake facilitator protein